MNLMIILLKKIKYKILRIKWITGNSNMMSYTSSINNYKPNININNIKNEIKMKFDNILMFYFT